MLEKYEKIVLNYINSNCKSGNFIVVTIDEIFSFLGVQSTVDKVQIKTAVANLFSSGFIRLKYDDGETFCVSTTEKGLNYKEQTFANDVQVVVKRNSLVGWCVFASFVGGFVGAAIAIFLSIIWRA